MVFKSQCATGQCDWCVWHTKERSQQLLPLSSVSEIRRHRANERQVPANSRALTIYGQQERHRSQRNDRCVQGIRCVIQRHRCTRGHPKWYKRERVPVIVKGKEIMCWVYFNPIELQPHHKFLKSYEESYSIGNFRSKSIGYKTYRKPVKKFNQISLFDDCNDKDLSTGISTTKCCTHSGCNERNIAFDGWGNYYCESCGRWYQ